MFSEAPQVGFRTLRDEAFNVSGGTVRKAQRQQSGSDQSWNITVQPDGHDDVSIQLPATGSCSASGAICTSDGRPLSNALAATVTGPVAMTVADPRVEEAANAVVAFAVTLSRTATAQVTVDYTTRDGSAQADSDYTAKSGTLTFQAGESSKTIELAVLDDSHDEGEETFTLALSNASGAADRDPREAARRSSSVRRPSPPSTRRPALQAFGIGAAQDAVVERLVGDAPLRQLPLEVLVPVDAQLGAVGEVRAEPQEGAEVLVHRAEVEVVAHRRRIGQPR